MEEQTQPLFEKSRAAVAFALNHSRSLYSQPLMTKAANALSAAQEKAQSSGRLRPGREELRGLDGAAQAGLIYIHLDRLAPFQRECLISRTAVHSFPCNCRSACCMGVRPNPEWVEAIKKVSDYLRNEIDRRQAKARKKITINPQLRRMLIERHFGRKHTLGDLAEQFQLSENTVASYSKTCSEILSGWEKDGWTAMDTVLSELDIIGSTV